MKRILPSMRVKERYLVFEAEVGAYSPEHAKLKFMGAVKDLFGEFGLAKANISFLPDWKNGRGIACVANNAVDIVRASLCFTNKPKLRVIGISGAIKEAREKYLI
ncbi:hypothetical protein HZB88_04520 [archaeon]|nr:hypothetical protein [archaeon]